MGKVTADDIQQLLDMGMTKKEAGEQLGLSAQKVGMILKEQSAEAVQGEIVDEIPAHTFAKKYADVARTGEGQSKIVIMTAEEYREYSKANRRFEGRPKDKKIMPKLEEFRALINADAKPSYIMNKYGINEEEFKQLIWKLSKLELRDKPIGYNIAQDYIQK